MLNTFFWGGGTGQKMMLGVSGKTLSLVKGLWQGFSLLVLIRERLLMLVPGEQSSPNNSPPHRLLISTNVKRATLTLTSQKSDCHIFSSWGKSVADGKLDPVWWLDRLCPHHPGLMGAGSCTKQLHESFPFRESSQVHGRVCEYAPVLDIKYYIKLFP